MYVRNIPSQEGHEFDKVCVMCMQVRRGRRSRGGRRRKGCRGEELAGLRGQRQNMVGDGWEEGRGITGGKRPPPLLSRKRVVEGLGGGKVVRWGGWLLWFNIYQIFAL